MLALHDASQRLFKGIFQLGRHHARHRFARGAPSDEAGETRRRRSVERRLAFAEWARERFGIEVEVARTGDEALAKVLEFGPDLVLLDATR